MELSVFCQQNVKGNLWKNNGGIFVANCLSYKEFSYRVELKATSVRID
jgi:hypothetical protein